MADKRARVWTIVVYPEDSLPDNYISILDNLHLLWCESPLHDSDLNGDESEKKVHKHLVFFFDGPKSFDQVKEIANLLNAPIPKVVHNSRAMVRYLIHLDNPEKHQYDKDQIICHGGVDIEQYFIRSSVQFRHIMSDIIEFCQGYGITEFCDLVDMAFQKGDEDWIEVLTNRNTMFFSAYLRSRHFKEKEDMQ